jgi:hypothetical protein
LNCLGAEKKNILRLVLRDGMKLALIEWQSDWSASIPRAFGSLFLFSLPAVDFVLSQLWSAASSYWRATSRRGGRAGRPDIGAVYE